MTTQQNTTLDALADTLAAALGELDPAGQRLAIALYRLLAAGRPVATADLAASTGLPEPAVAEALGSWPAVFTDGQGRVTGFWGLAISELSPAHRYESGGQVLYAWCAWDTLFLPARLGRAARVTSPCPVTGELITLTVTPDGVTQTSHPQAVVSFLMPDGPFDSGVIESFCHFVHFFASRQAGEQWVAGHPGTFLLTLGEAADVAAHANRRMFPDALGHGEARTAKQLERRSQQQVQPSLGRIPMLEPLFDAELDYRPGMAPLTSEGDGALIGSGDGAVHGPKLTGKLEWTLFEHAGSTMCPMAPVAKIITGDGARIRFEGRGYGTRPSPSDPVWRVAATLHFTTGDSRYSWLDGALALWEGEFNETTHHARYTAFI